MSVSLFHSLNQRQSFASLGSLEILDDFRAPTSLSDAEGYNTVKLISGSYHFTKGYDFSGRGRHVSQTVDANMPKLITNPETGIGTVADFNGTQFFSALSFPAVACGTIILRLRAGTYTTGDGKPLNMVGTFNDPITGNTGFAGFGNVSGGITGETFSILKNNILHTKTAISSGFNTIGFSPGTSPAIYLNGVAVHEALTGQTDAFLVWSIGKRELFPAQTYTGQMEFAAAYSNKLTPEAHMRAHKLLTL